VVRMGDEAKLRAHLGADFVLVGPDKIQPQEPDENGEGGDWSYHTSIGSRDALAVGLGPDFLGHLVLPLKKRTTFFADTFVVGRAANSDVCIDDPSVSKLHARIRKDPSGALTLSDGGSANGTRARGRLLGSSETVPLASGNDLQFGDRAFRFYGMTELHDLLLRLGRTPAGGSQRPPGFR
jgi:hypothetical protein